MPFPFLLALGIGLNLVGTGLRLAGAAKQSQAEQANEQVRKEQLTLDTARAKREAIRQSLFARSLALTNATNQGAQYGTGLQGGYGQISGATRRTLTGLEENKNLGLQIFENNADISKAGMLFSAGSGLSSLGSSLVQNWGTLNRLGTFLGVGNP